MKREKMVSSLGGVKVVDAQDFKPYLLPLMIVNQKSSYLLTVRNPLSPPTCSRILVMAFYSPFDMISWFYWIVSLMSPYSATYHSLNLNVEQPSFLLIFPSKWYIQGNCVYHYWNIKANIEGLHHSFSPISYWWKVPNKLIPLKSALLTSCASEAPNSFYFIIHNNLTVSQPVLEVFYLQLMGVLWVWLKKKGSLPKKNSASSLYVFFSCWAK